MADLNTLASQFVQYYYQVFQSDRSNLKPLYRDDSMLTFEGAPFKGVNDIIGKLTSLPFQQVAHRIATLDAQPSINNGIIVMVTGELLIDQETNATRFSQAFQLIPDSGNYWAKPDESDLKELSIVLDIRENYLINDFGTKTYFPDRGGLFQMPPTDPVIYRFYEILQVYGYPLKAVIHEKFGDGIMSAIDFTAKVDKIKKEDHEKVKITFEGKFLPYRKW
ncbi:unnamed protein product [Rhizophagus irregularis]|nr:unnamed protein product [Rhizophagus irregularis]